MSVEHGPWLAAAVAIAVFAGANAVIHWLIWRPLKVVYAEENIVIPCPPVMLQQPVAVAEDDGMDLPFLCWMMSGGGGGGNLDSTTTSDDSSSDSTSDDSSD